MTGELYLVLMAVLLFTLAMMLLLLGLVHSSLKKLLKINIGIYEKIQFIPEDVMNMKVSVMNIESEVWNCSSTLENIKNDVELFAEQKRKDDRERWS